MTIEDENAINEFLLDISCLDELKKWETGFNVFDILNISRTEIRHSNVLGWLLNSKGDHNLGDSVLYNLLNEILKDNPNCKFKQSKLLLMDLYSFDIIREDGYIDICLSSSKEKFVIVIENKIFTGEHDNQLSRYKEYTNKHYENYDVLYLYLTPYGDDSSDTDNWLSISYNKIYIAIQKALSERDTSSEVKMFISNYLEILRRDIMEDQELKNICNKIYIKHQKALDLIFNNCERGNARYYSAIRSALSDLAKENIIIYDDPTSTRFYFESADNSIPFMKENNSSFGTNRCYQFWVEVDWKNRVVVHFELGGANLSHEQNIILNKLIENGHGKMKRYDSYQYQRIEKETEKINEDDDSFETVVKITKSRVEKIIKKVMDLIEKSKI